jgi:hypothetical protein
MQEEQESVKTNSTQEIQELTPRQIAAKKYERDELGLLNSIDYIFNDDGSIRWRDMIKPEFLYVNKEYFERFGKEAPKSTDGLKDNQLSIMLGGIKELAKLRGFNKVSYKLTHEKSGDHVSAACTINWIPNYESDYRTISFEDFGNASVNNTDDFCHKFLETIACNRAFIRAVRNYLGIHIVGVDELDKSDKSKSMSMDASNDEENASISKPSEVLEKKAEFKGFKVFIDFKTNFLREMWRQGLHKNEEAKNWNSYEDIPAKDCRDLLKLLDKPILVNS